MIEVNKKNIRFRKGIKLKVIYNGFCAVGLYYYNNLFNNYDMVEYISYTNSNGKELMYKVGLQCNIKDVDMYYLKIIFKNVGIDLWL